MKFEFDFAREEAWPPLAWIALCREGDSVIRVHHGKRVEVRPDWFCEAIWDGDFDAGDFDRTDVVFGSGGRLREDGLRFVSSASTVDRIHVLKRLGEAVVSNSLPCLLSLGKTGLDPAFGAWTDFFLSIKHGIDAYARRVPTVGAAVVELIYFRNLKWDGRLVEDENKPALQRDFRSFAGYYGFLLSSVQCLATNMEAPSRGHRYEMLGTLSSGYDAATAATICSKAGMRQAVSAARARGGGGSDDGREIAEKLGLQLLPFERAAWRDRTMPEVAFFAANPRGGEVFLSGAEELIRGKVLVTGFHGDKVWGKGTKALGGDIVRGDMSGLSLCEYRLHAGFIHFPLAFLGVRQIRDINALSNSPELASWDISGDYSRPICRRIVEEAGVPRDAFGMKKKMASVHFGQGESLLTRQTMDDVHNWLRDRKNLCDSKCGDAPGAPSRVLVALRERYYLLVMACQAAARPLPSRARRWIGRKLTELQTKLNRRVNVPECVFPWAIDKTSEVYRGAGGSHTCNSGVAREH